MEFVTIKKTPFYDAFSDLGKRIFLPEGIFYWSARAKKEADIDGTIGSAFGFEKDFIDGGSSDWLPCYLKDIKNYTKLSVKEIVPYAPIGGIVNIREIWKKWIVTKSSYDDKKEKDKIDKLNKYISLPLITAGVTNGIYSCCALFLNPGEFIISPNKRWENYDTIINRYIGARIKSFEFFKNKKLNIEGLKDAIDEVAKVQDKILLILNFPNNPTGYNPTLEESKELISLLRKSQKSLGKPIIVLVDDAYEPYVYSNNVLNRSLFYDLHQLEENIIPIKLDGITKELLLYSGRIGFVTLGLKSKWVKNDEELEKLKNELNNKLEGINRSTISNCNIFYQSLTEKLFKEVGTDKIVETRNKIKNLLKARYEKINAELSKIDDPHISIDPNSGGFFLFINLDPNKFKATELADHLLKKYKVGVIPFEDIDENVNGIRIAYCSIDLGKITEFKNRIHQALKDF